MRIKLDENMPAELALVLSRLGHDVDTVPQEGLAGESDAIVWAETQSAGRFLITQDLDFANMRHYQPGTHFGLLLLRLHTPTRRRLIERLSTIFLQEPVDEWSRGLVVVTDHKIRIRRPG